MNERRILIVGADFGIGKAMLLALAEVEAGNVVVLDSCTPIERRVTINEPTIPRYHDYDNTAQWKRERGYGPHRAPMQRTIRGGKR